MYTLRSQAAHQKPKTSKQNSKKKLKTIQEKKKSQTKYAFWCLAAYQISQKHNHSNFPKKKSFTRVHKKKTKKGGGNLDSL